MKIIGTEGMSDERLNYELQRGGKFVIYQYCISIVVMTFKRGSDIYFIPSSESAVRKGLMYSAISIVFGWWGFPWGPIYTIGALFSNFSGGKDVTADLIKSLQNLQQRSASTSGESTTPH